MTHVSKSIFLDLKFLSQKMSRDTLDFCFKQTGFSTAFYPTSGINKEKNLLITFPYKSKNVKVENESARAKKLAIVGSVKRPAPPSLFGKI